MLTLQKQRIAILLKVVDLRLATADLVVRRTQVPSANKRLLSNVGSSRAVHNQLGDVSNWQVKVNDFDTPSNCEKVLIFVQGKNPGLHHAIFGAQITMDFDLGIHLDDIKKEETTQDNAG